MELVFRNLEIFLLPLLLLSLAACNRQPSGNEKAGLDMKAPVVALVQALSFNDYFSYLAKLLKTNPPEGQDAPIIPRMAKIGLVPGQVFDPSKLSAFDKEAVMAVPKLGLMKMLKRVKEQQPINGWLVFGSNVGNWALIIYCAPPQRGLGRDGIFRQTRSIPSRRKTRTAMTTTALTTNTYFVLTKDNCRR